ncbi:hypothetical protein DKP76_09100 [Falsochrobactrum shanghaiense]|uniref:Flagellar biosynthesis protein FliO n=1 Tax=Falsochrobactrum shanghaiense TaxID=2201899 RepID=A0A316J7N3_9HYPH|nr:flagellar biosynthetic protein FliO [Falsochrobactrum shanghaiense]PWL17907.1 hypothetical protein DKP76_09100 [Falsochrobactrum shanghaiense]
MKEWLSGLVGENAANIVGFVLVFAIILGGIFVVLSILRRFSGGSFSAGGRGGRQPRLSVMDAAAVDNRRKLVLIRRDDVEHLLLIGGPTDVVVEQNITSEPRIASRTEPSRIEPGHIERFRQHEATITSDKENTIQLNSPIETPVFAEPFPVREEAPAFQPEREAAQKPVAPQPPVTPAAPQMPQTPPQPRSTTHYPPQPRTVVPPRPAEQQSPSPRLHPVYPLSRVSRGVLTSTSGAASVREQEKIVPKDAGDTVPDRETAPQKPVVAEAATLHNITPKAEEPRASSGPEFVDNNLEGLSGALNDAIMSDLSADETIPEGQKEFDKFEVEDFESELLGSLDISPDGNKPEHNIEDEMEKLLGELTRDETRHR